MHVFHERPSHHTISALHWTVFSSVFTPQNTEMKNIKTILEKIQKLRNSKLKKKILTISWTSFRLKVSQHFLRVWKNSSSFIMENCYRKFGG
jgi:hypothetical protein